MSKSEKFSNMLISAGLFMVGAPLFLNSFFYTVDAGNFI